MFRKSVERRQVVLKCGKNNGYFALNAVYIYDNISLNSSYNKKCFRQNLYRKSTLTFVLNNFLSENLTVYEIMWREMGQPDRPKTSV
jgi:hypothetical protein